MSRVDPAVKEAISQLSKKELEKLVLKAAQKNKEFYDFLLVNYIDKEDGCQALFEDAKGDLESLFRKSYRGFSEELRIANMLSACNKRISSFEKVCKDKHYVLQLAMYVLEIPFSLTQICLPLASRLIITKFFCWFANQSPY